MTFKEQLQTIHQEQIAKNTITLNQMKDELTEDIKNIIITYVKEHPQYYQVLMQLDNLFDKYSDKYTSELCRFGLTHEEKEAILTVLALRFTDMGFKTKLFINTTSYTANKYELLINFNFEST